MRIFLLLLSLAGILTFSSCKDENPRVDIPFRFVHEEINLSSIQNQNLWNPGGHIYIPNAGYKGIIVINQGGNIYSAFERACTYDPKAECAIVQMDDSGLFLIDHCCNSSFTLGGIPSGGPAFAQLVAYQTFLNGDILLISNE